jgi:sulfatase modifying factor 1
MHLLALSILALACSPSEPEPHRPTDGREGPGAPSGHPGPPPPHQGGPPPGDHGVQDGGPPPPQYPPTIPKPELALPVEQQPAYEMVPIPAGSFAMGCRPRADLECMGHELPAHEVTLRQPFELGRTEVTQELWLAVLGDNPAHFEGDPQRPVDWVSWCDALLFANILSERAGLRPAYELPPALSWGISVEACNTAALEVVWDRSAEGYRLPTEAEWEYAARAGQDTLYAGGDLLDAVGWHEGNAQGSTHPVARLEPNAWGLYDMSGNLLEWTWDWFDDYESGRVTDPVGPAEGALKARRGGYWDIFHMGPRVSDRAGRDPGSRTTGLGIRLARTP